MSNAKVLAKYFCLEHKAKEFINFSAEEAMERRISLKGF
jgi:hypothetical protein